MMDKRVMVIAKADSAELLTRCAEALSRTAVGLSLEGADILISIGDEEEE